MITLGNAAKQLGISKPTLSKAISKGHLSAARREDGSFAIDPSELMRWWEGVRHRFQAKPPYDFHGTTASGINGNSSGNPGEAGIPGNPSNEVASRLAALEVEVKGLKDLLTEVKQSRDDWKGQAERLVHALPAPALSSANHSERNASEGRRWWWRRATSDFKG